MHLLWEKWISIIAFLSLGICSHLDRSLDSFRPLGFWLVCQAL